MAAACTRTYSCTLSRANYLLVVAVKQAFFLHLPGPRAPRHATPRHVSRPVCPSREASRKLVCGWLVGWCREGKTAMPLKLGAAAWRRWEGGPHASTATLFLLPDFPTFPTERKRASRHRFKSAVSAGASGAGEGGEGGARARASDQNQHTGAPAWGRLLSCCHIIIITSAVGSSHLCGWVPAITFAARRKRCGG